MSDPDRRSDLLADGGESARTGLTGGEKPAGVCVVGEIRVREEKSDRSATFTPEDINQLALALMSKMQPQHRCCQRLASSRVTG